MRRWQDWPERPARPKVRRLSAEERDRYLNRMIRAIERSPVLSALSVEVRALRGRFYVETCYWDEGGIQHAPSRSFGGSFRSYGHTLMIWIAGGSFISPASAARCVNSATERALNAEDWKAPASFWRFVPGGAGVRWWRTTEFPGAFS